MPSIYLPPWRIDVTVRGEVNAHLSAAAIARTAARALDAAGAPSPASVAVILTDDAELAGLNEKHMGEHGPTDVLSFPMLPPGAFPPHPGQRAGMTRSTEAEFVLPPGQRPHLGDIIVSVERAEEQAKSGRGGQTGDVRWSVADELRLLVVHGTLHVCGWDHADADERDAMRGLESRLLSAADASEAEHWRRYYDVTVDRPAWETVRVAIANFAADDPPRGGLAAARAHRGSRAPAPRFAVDLGAGAGRDARALLRAGWRVLAIDREARGLRILGKKTPDGMHSRLATQVADLATVDIPAADLVNASLSLPFLPEEAFWSTWSRMLSAIGPGGRVAAMVFGNRDEGMGEPGMTYVEPSAFRATLEGDFEIEHWVDVEEDTKLALGQPHHVHRVEVVAKRHRQVVTTPPEAHASGS